MPQSIYLRKSLSEELLDRALLLLKRMKSPNTEEHRWAGGVHSPREVRKFMELLDSDETLRKRFPKVERPKQHVRDAIAQRGLMSPRAINGRVHTEYEDDMKRDDKNLKAVFDPHGGGIETGTELLDYIQTLASMVAYQYDLRPDEENSSFAFAFAHRGGQDYDPVSLDEDGNKRMGYTRHLMSQYDAIVQPEKDEDGKTKFVIKTIVSNATINPFAKSESPITVHNHIDLTSPEPTMLSRDPIGDGEFDSKQEWEEGAFRDELDFHQRHPIVNALPEIPTKDTSGKEQKGIVTGLDDRKGVIQTLNDMEMPHPQTNKNMFAPKQVRGDNTALRLDWTGGKHKPGWNNHVDDMHGMIRSAIESLPEEHRESMGEAMFDSFHQSFDGMSPSHFELNRDGMRDVPGYSNSMDNHFNDYQWMLKALISMDRSLLLLKERKSPEAFAHKLEYDKKYQKNPKRVKYRVQLNRERRKRGIYGKGGKDVSHTQGNKLTLENPHSNRARHFKNRGTLRRVKVR